MDLVQSMTLILVRYLSESKTTLLMRYFYDNISEDKDYAMALKEAKLKMIDDNIHPYFWSAFIIHGI